MKDSSDDQRGSCSFNISGDRYGSMWKFCLHISFHPDVRTGYSWIEVHDSKVSLHCQILHRNENLKKMDLGVPLINSIKKRVLTKSSVSKLVKNWHTMWSVTRIEHWMNNKCASWRKGSVHTRTNLRQLYEATYSFDEFTQHEKAQA